MTPRPLRVVKLGGSLLLHAGLAATVRAWLAQQSPAANLLVAGGGALVDAIRAADERHRLAAADSHDLAMACLSLTARLLATLLPELRPIAEPTELAAWRLAGDEAAIFDLGAAWSGAAWRDDGWRRMLGELPRDWTTTSDSLAAVVARPLRAFEVVLLKSADPPAAANDLHDLAAADFVDAVLPDAIAGLPLRCVNLRDARFAERRFPGKLGIS